MSEGEAIPEDEEQDAASTGGNGSGEFPGVDTRSTYIAIDGIPPGDMDQADKEKLLIELQNMLLADFGYPIEDVRIIESPRYVVEFDEDADGGQ